MKRTIELFFEEILCNNIEVYNEFSLQHELGIYLRNRFPDNKVQFERNISHFGWGPKDFEISKKKEIDISVVDSCGNPCTAIELKYPRNGQHPEQMFSFCRDVSFAEELLKAGFRETYAIILAEDKLFYSGRRVSRIYSYFRNGCSLTGTIPKPTGSNRESLEISGEYKINWRPNNSELKFALVKAKIPIH